MSEISNSRRNRIVALVLVLGVSLAFLQCLAYYFWTRWETGVFSPISWQAVMVAWGLADITDGDPMTLVLALGGGLIFLATTLIALLPVLLAPASRVLLAGFFLATLMLSSAVAWWTIWPVLRWGVDNRLRVPVAIANWILALMCITAWSFWRRNPEGRAAFWYPVVMQIWLQTFWLPFPDDD